MSNVDNINDINRELKKNFESITIKTNKFPLKYHYQDYQLDIASLKTNDLLFTCNNSMYYFANTISQSSLYNFNQKFSEYQNISDLYEYILNIIKANILSIKVLPDIDTLLLCLTDRNNGDTIFQFFLRKLSFETIQNDIIKMTFKKTTDKVGQENNLYSLLFDSKSENLNAFNKLYKTKIIGNENFIDISFNDLNKTKNKPNKKINDSGFILFCKHKND